MLKRIVRSLGANVPDMRAGYFATLVTLLVKFEQIPVSQLFDLIKKELHANGSSKSVSLYKILNYCYLLATCNTLKKKNILI